MKSKSYSYVLLDWDGCLAKTLDIWLRAYRETFREYGLHPDDKTITHHVFGDWNGPKKLGIQKIGEFTDKLLKRVNVKYPRVALYPHVRQVVKQLRKRNKKLALITTSKRSTIQPAIDHHHLTESFDTILTAEDVTKHKPDPEIITIALDRLRGSRSKAIIVGDSKSDLGAAIGAGIDSLLFHPKHNELFYDLDVLTSYHPTYIIDNFKEVLKIIM